MPGSDSTEATLQQSWPQRISLPRILISTMCHTKICSSKICSASMRSAAMNSSIWSRCPVSSIWLSPSSFGMQRKKRHQTPHRPTCRKASNTSAPTTPIRLRSRILPRMLDWAEATYSVPSSWSCTSLQRNTWRIFAWSRRVIFYSIPRSPLLRSPIPSALTMDFIFHAPFRFQPQFL